MKKNVINQISTFIAALLLLSYATASAQERSDVSSKLDPGKVFYELIAPYKQLNDYTVKIHAKVDMPGFRIPEFKATLYFKKPDKYHIETKSIAPIPRSGGVFNPFQFDPGQNQITYIGTASLKGIQSEFYKVEPTKDRTRVRFYNVWVGGNPKRILQVESYSYKGARVLVVPTYKDLQQGNEKLLLPETVYIHLSFPEAMQNPYGSSLIAKDNPISRGMSGLDDIAKEGDILITYSEWHINTGLEDGFFKKKDNR